MFVKTRSSLLNNQSEDSCKTVVFNSKKKSEAVPLKKKSVNANAEANRKERFDGSKKEESRVALAVALGAKPPKRKCRNYAEILSEKKAEAKNKDNAIKNRATKPFGLKGKPKFKRNGKGRGSLLGSYGKVKQDK